MGKGKEDPPKGKKFQAQTGKADERLRPHREELNKKGKEAHEDAASQRRRAEYLENVRRSAKRGGETVRKMNEKKKKEEEGK